MIDLQISLPLVFRKWIFFCENAKNTIRKRSKRMEKRLFTSESVTEGHPDKVCDAISDAILDACMAEDPMSRVACETASCTGFVLVTGEITTKAQLDIPAIVRKTVNEIGYNDAKTGFDGNTCAVMVALDQQSPDIAMGVDKALEAKEGALTDDLDTAMQRTGHRRECHIRAR